jgi:hypothetical protein
MRSMLTERVVAPRFRRCLTWLAAKHQRTPPLQSSR